MVRRPLTQNVSGAGTATLGFEEGQQVSVELLLVRTGQAVGAPGETLRVACSTSFAAVSAAAPFGTVWLSSPYRINVGTSNVLRSSSESVSEKALMQSSAFFPLSARSGLDADARVSGGYMARAGHTGSW
jgi:hypothetical protein